jgi:hypothetical protein
MLFRYGLFINYLIRSYNYVFRVKGVGCNDQLQRGGGGDWGVKLTTCLQLLLGQENANLYIYSPISLYGVVLN